MTPLTESVRESSVSDHRVTHDRKGREGKGREIDHLPSHTHLVARGRFEPQPPTQPPGNGMGLKP